MSAPITTRPLSTADAPAALAAINEAARWYREFLPADEHHEPEMTESQWRTEAARLTWYGAFEGHRLLGVMGLEPAGDAVLLRHAYVLPDAQRRGVGALLVARLEAAARDGHPSAARLIVGTYLGNYKARAALEKLGYRPSPDPESVLRAYYAIPEDRLRASLTYEKPIARR